MSLASQTHQVPHIGLPHNDPVISVNKEKINPTGAMLLPQISANGCFQIKYTAEEIAKEKYKIEASQADGTWIYIILTVSLCW